MSSSIFHLVSNVMIVGSGRQSYMINFQFAIGFPNVFSPSGLDLVSAKC